MSRTKHQRRKRTERGVHRCRICDPLGCIKCESIVCQCRRRNEQKAAQREQQQGHTS